MPDLSAVRLDPFGNADVRMDLYYGGRLPADENAIRSLLESFQFGDNRENSSPDEKRLESPGEDVGIPDWRTVFLPEPTAPLGAPMQPSSISRKTC